MKKINVGIIGRNFGYKVIYNAIKKDKSFNVLGFSFKNKILKNSLPEDVKIYQNWKHLISDKKINAVIISSPPKTHKEIIKFALKRKKSIFCDKPVTTSLKDISIICELLKKKRIINMVNYEFSNIEAFSIFKKRYLKKIKIKKIKIDWSMKIPKLKRSGWKNSHSSGGGNFFNYICHVLYYLENMFGKLTINDSKIIKLEKNFTLKSNFLIEKKKINILFNFKILKKDKFKSFHRMIVYSDKGNYILKTKLSNLFDQFYLKKNNKTLFKPNKINYDFRLKPTYENLIKFKKSILTKKTIGPDFNEAKRVHNLIGKLIYLSK